MKVLVSGTLGRIGRYVYRDLVDHGHDALGVDTAPPPSEVGNSLRVDLTNAGEVYGALGGFGSDAVIRLGAWAHAGQVPDAKTYGDNVTGTFNVFQTCAEFGIQRVGSALDRGNG